jgi:hypothetical protein
MSSKSWGELFDAQVSSGKVLQENTKMKREMQDMIEDLRDARASGRVYTYGNIQEKLRRILGEEPE